MTPREREYVARLCASRAGLKAAVDKDYLVESRLGPVARREGFGSVSELVQAVRDRADEGQVWALVEAMAHGDTAFFRDREVFSHLWREAIPELARRREGGLVRIWSAGCSTGQEVYSLAMLMEQAPIPGVQVELFASDLSERMLEKAQSGLYSQFEVQRGLSARELVDHFEKRDEAFVLSRRVRQHVRWRRVNLMDDLTRLGAFDVVLCRNVLGALVEDVRPGILERLGALTPADGLLVLGADETRPARGFEPREGAAGVFQRPQGVSKAA